MAPPGQATLPILHRFLGIGVALLAVVVVGLKLAGVAPLMNVPEAGAKVIVYIFTSASFLLLFLAVFIFKPRAPERRAGQTAAEYWTTPDMAMPALRVWFLLEGAGILAMVCYMATGAAIALIAAAVAILAFWKLGPNAFAKP
jgi:hypothetical protein